MKRRLVIAAHADDETIGCGGTMAKYSQHGATTFVGVLTRDQSDDVHTVRRSEAERAWQKLGVTDSGWAEMRAHPLTVSPTAVDAVTGWIESVRPDIVFLPHPGEDDPDHAAVAAIVKSARILARSGCLLLGYEVWTPLARPSVFEDVSDFVAVKGEAINCFRSQVADRDYASAALALNRYHGVISGRGQHVEAFGMIS